LIWGQQAKDTVLQGAIAKIVVKRQIL